MQLQQAQRFFVNRIPAVWNKLPDAVVFAPCFDILKKCLNLFDLLAVINFVSAI